MLNISGDTEAICTFLGSLGSEFDGDYDRLLSERIGAEMIETAC